MTVNLVVDGCTKTPNQWKILGRMQKDNTVLNLLKPKYKLMGGWCFHLVGQEIQIAPLPSRQLHHCNKHHKILIKQN